MSDHSNYGRSLLLTSINQALQPKGFQQTNEELNVGEVSPSNSGVREVMVTVSIANPNGIQKNINGEQVTLVGDKTVHYDRINFRDIFNAAGHKYAVIDEVSSSAEFVQAINDRYGLSFIEGVDAWAHNFQQQSESDPHPHLTYVDVGDIVSVSAEDDVPPVDEKGRDVIGYVFWEDNVMRTWCKYVWQGSDEGSEPSFLNDLYVFAPEGEINIRVIPIDQVRENPADDTYYRIMFTEGGPVVEHDADLSGNWGPDPEQNPYSRELFVQLARKSVEDAYEEVYNDTWFYLEQTSTTRKRFIPDRRFDAGYNTLQQALIWEILAGGVPGFDEAASASGEKYLLSAGEGFQTVALVAHEDHVAFRGCMPVRMGQAIPLVIEEA